MPTSHTVISTTLQRLAAFRKAAGIQPAAVEEKLLLGPGWIERFESGNAVPSLELLLVLLRMYGKKPEELFHGVEVTALPEAAQRQIYAEQDGKDLLIKFPYARHDSVFRLRGATIVQFDEVIKTLRDGLARLVRGGGGDAEALKAESVANAYLKAVSVWPDANPSDLWWFVISRCYFDPFNHPAYYARLDFGQSWKRTGGWALEIILVEFYGRYLAKHGIHLYIPTGTEKQGLTDKLTAVGPEARIEADKIDVFLAGEVKGELIPFGVVHVKASFAERRTDDVPLSSALVKAGYTSPLWTMDCKGAPSATPTNEGELGETYEGSGRDRRSAKRKDFEVDGLFSACFSYNSLTKPTPDNLKAKARVLVCNFKKTDDAFSAFIIESWKAYSAKHHVQATLAVPFVAGKIDPIHVGNYRMKNSARSKGLRASRVWGVANDGIIGGVKLKGGSCGTGNRI